MSAVINAPQRDIVGDILGHLLRVPAEQNYVTALADNLNLSRTTIRNNLRVMQSDGWVRCYPSSLLTGGANIWELTAKGRQVAQWRRV